MTTANQLAGIINPATGQIYDANAPSGSVIQVVQGTSSSIVAISTSLADTGLSASITPSSSSSKILVLVTHFVRVTTGTDTGTGLFLVRNSTTVFGSGTNYTALWRGGEEIYAMLSMSYLDSPSTASSITYKTQARANNASGAVNINPQGQTSVMILMEIAA